MTLIPSLRHHPQRLPAPSETPRSALLQGRRIDAVLFDLDGVLTDTASLHLAAGTVDLLQRCYAGLEVRNDALWLNPVLPDEVERLRFGLTYRGHWVDLDIDHDRVGVSAATGQADPSNVVVAGRLHVLEAGQRIQQAL